jgi:hypothetical protein
MALDLASVEMASSWSAHLTVGEASFDDFHFTRDPVYTGSADHKWPVNGFLYGGPTAQRNLNQTIYVGLYGAGYAYPWSMLGMGSTDGGHEWNVSKGPLVCDYKTLLYNISHGCPDGTAVDDGNGGVHMIFDWNTNIGASSRDNGLGYQHCASPLGPCKISAVPVNRMADNIPISPGYISTYGGTLLKRKSDWLVLTAMSTRGNAGGIWALAAMTSNGSDPDPAASGYSRPELMLHPESNHWHPHPCEFFPCFADASYAYCPCTSLQKSRGMQVLYRAALESAHQPTSWEVYQSGSFYHWLGQDSAPGLWGQTFSGFVDVHGGLQVMYPSKSRAGLGTINMARAPNFAQLRSPGFWVSAPSSDQLTVFSKTFSSFTLHATIRAAAVGKGWTLRWNWRGEIGVAGAPFADGVMHPSSLSQNTALCLDGRGHYSLVQINATGGVKVLKPPTPFGPPPSPAHYIPWVRVRDKSAVYGVPITGSPTTPLLGTNVTTEAECRALCEARLDCTVYVGIFDVFHALRDEPEAGRQLGLQERDSQKRGEACTLGEWCYLCFGRTDDVFELVPVAGAVSARRAGVPPAPPSTGGGDRPVRIELSQTAAGQVSITLNDTLVVEGLQLDVADVTGSIAVHATSGASVQVTEMLVSAGTTADVPQRWMWLTASDGVTGGGDASIGGWVEKTDHTFRTGHGFASPGGNTTLAKWNFIGVGVRLWLPKGPAYGTISVSVDGIKPVLVHSHAVEPAASAVVFEWHEPTGDLGRAGLEHAHALVVRWVSGEMVADSAEYLPPPLPAARAPQAPTAAAGSAPRTEGG